MKASNTCTIRKQGYKAVISVTNIDCDRTLNGKILMSLDSDGSISDILAIPTSYPVILDVGKDLEKIKATFYLSEEHADKEICSGSLIIPADIAYNVEINTSSRIHERVYEVHTLDDMLGVDFKITFVNTILFERQGEPLP